MPSDLQVSNIKDQANANSAITIASDGQITVNQNNPTVTLGTNAKLPQGTITNVHCSTSNITPAKPGTDFSDVAGGSSVSYTPTTGARYVVYQYTCAHDNDDTRGIVSFRLQLDTQNYANELGGLDTDSGGGASSHNITMCCSITLASITTDFSGHSGGHNWQTNAGGTSAFSAGTLRLLVACHHTSYETYLHRISHGGASAGNVQIRPTTLIYSVM